MLYIELGDLFPPQHQQQQQQQTTTTINNNNNNHQWHVCVSQQNVRADGRARKQQTTNSKQQKNKEQSLGTVSGRFWDGFGTVSKSGSIGTVLGTLLVPKAEFSPEENQRSERYLRKHLGIRSPALLAYPRVALPPCPRTAEYLCRSKPPHGSANFGGSPRTKGTREMADLGDSPVWRSGRRRGLPFRPYLHARISRITVVEQLPQLNIIIINYELVN